ncbi:MAG TPA: hypothetical protein IAC45_03175 [Candidatus Aphodousia faecavium]|nr:hypothetical protein [Candidatus Aphodousia faecavium]
MTVAVTLAFLSTSSLATDYQFVEFPILADWTLEGSVAEGLKAEKHNSIKGWDYYEYQPFVLVLNGQMIQLYMQTIQQFLRETQNTFFMQSGT